MDWGAEHLIIIVGTGAGHFRTKTARGAGHLNNFFKCPEYARGVSRGGGFSRLELTRTSESPNIDVLST